MDNEKLRKIINHYGINKQLKYFQSEVFELNESIIGYENDYEGLYLGNDTNHIAEEIADVMVMLKQIQLYYDISTEDIKKIMKLKVDRSLEIRNYESKHAKEKMEV